MPKRSGRNPGRRRYNLPDRHRPHELAVKLQQLAGGAVGGTQLPGPDPQPETLQQMVLHTFGVLQGIQPQSVRKFGHDRSRFQRMPQKVFQRVHVYSPTYCNA